MIITPYHLNPRLNRAVFVSYDGVIDDDPIFVGKERDCMEFLRKNWRKYNVGKQSLDLMDRATGRLLSFML